ncbi:uncharacterized protein METZ01_LOCUS154514 [marine metagenome]|uniref:DoxX family protein n=1 Tax=marine metagenome TaxID=408172 RepID=A0A382AJB4_9ZZZZ
MKNFLQKIIILINIFILIYYSIQLLVFTDEFTLQNFGFYNHAIAGLSEILGILLLCLSIGLIFILIKGLQFQFALLFTIFLFEGLVALNLWRYVITNSPGETNIQVITNNAILFSLASISMLFLLVYKK